MQATSKIKEVPTLVYYVSKPAALCAHAIANLMNLSIHVCVRHCGDLLNI